MVSSAPTFSEQVQFEKQTLMRGAKPYNTNAQRGLEDNGSQINGLYSIVQFNSSCTSLTVQSEDLFDEDIIYYAQNGLTPATTKQIITR
jgi:hypothetical protein